MFKAILLVLVTVIVSASAGMWWLAQRALPITDGIITLKQLRHSAVVKFDGHGVPYVEAADDRDLWLVQGYITASERMFQMDMLRRSALGELSEIIGTSGLPHDRLMRIIGINRISEEEVKNLSAEVRGNLEAYCLGVNSYINEKRGRMPLEFVLFGYEPRLWKASDTIAILKQRQYELDESWRLDDLKQRIFDKLDSKLAKRLFGYDTSHGITRGSIYQTGNRLLSEAFDLLNNDVGVSLRPSWGSNVWAIAPAMSDSRGALLACDKHSAFTFPDNWFVCSLSSPTSHIAGATVPGIPGILLGRNESIAWGNASFKADVQDLFLEQFSPQFPGKYRTTSGWQNVKELVEEIPVRFADLFASKNVVEKIQITRHGPVLIKNDRTAVVLAWTGGETKHSSLETIQKINHARNWTEFTDALRNYNGPVETFIYSDRMGNVGFHVAGNIPLCNKTSRSQDKSGSILSVGWTGADDWNSHIAFNDLPNAFNPKECFCVASSQKLGDCETIGNPYPSGRITSILYSYKKSQQNVGLPEMALLQGDQYAVLAPLFRKQLHQSINRAEIIDRYQLTALELLDRWDCTLSKNSSAASIYEMLLRTITRRLLIPKLGPDLAQQYLERWPKSSQFVEHVLVEKPTEWLPPEERTYETFVLTSFAEALKNLRQALRSDNPSTWSWEHLHKIKFSSTAGNNTIASALSLIFNIRPLPIGGDQDCVNACNVVPAKDTDQFISDSGPTIRMLLDMSDQDKFYAVLPLGESGHLLSRHRTDQLKSWLNLEPNLIAFSRAQLDKQGHHKLILRRETSSGN